MKFKASTLALFIAAYAGLSGCNEQIAKQELTEAPGAPGAPSTWAYAGKNGIGTSYEQYQDGAYSDQAATVKVSKV